MIKFITTNEMVKIIEKRRPNGLFICRERDLFVACDNTTGDAWVEDFITKEEAVKWLEDEQHPVFKM